jgi:hypothetical protein
MRFLLLGIVLVLTIRATAQEADSTRTIPRFTLKTPVSTWLNPLRQAGALAGDIRISRSVSFDWSAGYIFSSSLLQYGDESYTGPRLRAGCKWFVGQDRPIHLFLGGEIKYYDIDIQSYNTFFRAGGRYTETLIYNRSHRIIGGLLRFGYRGYMGHQKRLFLELDAGLGRTQHQIKNQPPPNSNLVFADDCIDCTNRFLSPPIFDGVYSRPDILFTLQFGWAFW